MHQSYDKRVVSGVLSALSRHSKTVVSMNPVREGDRVGHARVLSTRETRYPCVFDSRGCLSTRDEEGGARARARALAFVREGEKVGVVSRRPKRAVRSLRLLQTPANSGPRHAFPPPPPPPSLRDATLATTVTLSSSLESRGGSPAFSSEARMSERRECAWLGWREMTEPLQRVRDRDGGEGGIKEGKEGGRHAALSPQSGPSFTERERSRILWGSPPVLTFVGCPTPSGIVTCRILPAFGRCSTASHPRRYASLPPFPPVPFPFVWRCRDDDDGGKETKFCHRRAIPSSSSALRPLSLAFVHRLANRAHRFVCRRRDAPARARASNGSAGVISRRALIWALLSEGRGSR